MKYTFKALVVSVIAVVALLATSPAAFAQNRSMSHSNTNRHYNSQHYNRPNNRPIIHSNVYNRNNNSYKHFQMNNNDRMNRDRFVRNNRYFQNNMVYIRGGYNRYLPYSFRDFCFSNGVVDRTVIIVDRSDQNNVLVLGNKSSINNNTVVIYVSHQTFLMISDRVDYNDFRDFRVDSGRHMISFHAPSGAYSTSDVTINYQ